MNERPRFAPEGLSEALLQTLSRHSSLNGTITPNTLLEDVRGHLNRIREAAQENPFVNTRLAEGIVNRLRVAVANWHRIPAQVQTWLKAAMACFADTFDEVPDLASPVGIEDDRELLNSCLRLAGSEDLCLAPAGFDEL